MSDFTSNPEKALDQWLETQHGTLVNDLAAALDLEAGLSEVMIPVRHANLVADVRDVLDIETGLRAILPDNPWWIEESASSPSSVIIAARRGTSARVFVSHASKDRALVKELHRQLVEDGHQVFLDHDLRDDTAVSEKWVRRLHQRLQWADAMVCVATSDYLASRRCTAELRFARSRGSWLLPVQAQPGVDDPLLRSVTDAELAPDSVGAALVKTLRRVDDTGVLGWPKDRSPFPGLRPFDIDEQRVLFGRTRKVTQLVRLLRSAAERVEAEKAALLVVGHSGCGKSSLVRAGLVPAIADEPGWWTLSPIVPGADPVVALVQELVAAARQVGLGWTVPRVRDRLDGAGLTELAGELLLAAPGRRRHLLVVVDQFGEMLTQAAPDALARFVGLLRPALAGPVQMVATLRSEFLDQLLGNPELATLPTRTVMLRPLRREALREVIEGPAGLAGIGVEEDLVAQLVADTGTGEALPLLALTLAQLAEGIDRGGQLSTARYGQLGGVQGALIRQADAALAGAVAVGGRSRVEVIAGLLRLVTVDELGHPTRRRVIHDELPDPMVAEFAVFVARRLLVTDIDNGSVVIEVAHEAFLSAWAPLNQAISAARAPLRARRVIESAAADWDVNSRQPTRLWEGGQLAAAVADTGARINAGSAAPPDRPRPSCWLRRRHRVLVTDRVDLSPRARDFLHASIRRNRRRRRRASAVLAVLLILTLVATGSAVIQQRAAQEAQRIATVRQLIAQADVARTTDLGIALKLSVAAVRIHPDGETQSSLINLLANSGYSNTLTGHAGPVNSVVFSPDGHILATVSADRTVRLWDLTDPQQPTPAATVTGHAGPVNSVVFSPNGHTVATASSDRTVRIWDVTDLRRPAEVATLTGHSGAVLTVAFSSDGRTLATGDHSRTVRVWDVADPRRPAEVATLTGHSGTVNVVAFSPDGRTLATADADQTVRLWDVTDPHQPTPAYTLAERTGSHRLALLSAATRTIHTGQVHAVAFAQDGRTLATAGADRTVTLWDLRDPHAARQLGPPLSTGHTYSVVGAAFAPDGRTLATASADRTVTLWDLSTRTQPRPVELLLTSQNGVVRSLDFAPNGHILAAGSDYGTTILWDLNRINDLREHAAERACSITEGGLNRDEWARYISDLPYEQTCPNT